MRNAVSVGLAGTLLVAALGLAGAPTASAIPKDAWESTATLDVSTAAACPDVVTAKEALTIRRGPGPNYNKVGHIDKGAHFCIVKVENGASHEACDRDSWDQWAKLRRGGYVTTACIVDAGPGRP